MTEQTFGQKAVGVSFNPSGDDAVTRCKEGFAYLIDQMNDLRTELSSTPGNHEAVRLASVAITELRTELSSTPGNHEAVRLASVAITELQTAQMWAVKALTWRD